MIIKYLFIYKKKGIPMKILIFLCMSLISLKTFSQIATGQPIKASDIQALELRILALEESKSITATVKNVNGTYTFGNDSRQFTITVLDLGLGIIDYSSLNLSSPPRIFTSENSGDESTNIRTIEFNTVTNTSAKFNMKAKDGPSLENINFNGVFEILIVK